MLRFRLRTLLIAVAVLAMPMAWVSYQLNWIRQRREILSNPKVQETVTWLRRFGDPGPAPWPLGLFGEKRANMFSIRTGGPIDPETRRKIRRLFPEIPESELPPLIE